MKTRTREAVPPSETTRTLKSVRRSFSSWGALPDLTLKPDLAAVGGNIYSTLDGGTYGTMSGTSMATPVIAGSVAELASLSPDVSLELREGSVPEILELVTSGIAEVGVVRTPFPTQGLRTRYAPAEPLVAVMPPALERGDELTVLLAQLEDVPIVCDSRTAASLDLGRSPFCVTESARSVCSCAAAGLGVGLVPRSLLTVCDTGPCYIKTLVDKDLENRAAVIWKAGCALSPLAERAVALLGELS